MAKHTPSRHGQTHPVRGKNPNQVLQTWSSSEPGHRFLLASPPRAQGVHAFVGWHFHPLGHYFEIRAQRSQRSCRDLAHHHHKIWVVAAQFATVEGFRTSSHISAGTVHTSLAQAAHLQAGFASSHLRKVWERGKTSQTYCNSTTHSLQP